MKVILTFILIISSFFGFSQKSITDIDRSYNYFSFSTGDKWWLSSGSGWHSYDGIQVRDYIINEESSGLKGIFIQNPLIPDNDETLWTASYNYLCFYIQNEDRFSCFQPVYKGDTLKSELRAIHFFEKESELLFTHKKKLLLLDTKSQKVSLYYENLNENVVITNFENNELLSSPWVDAPIFERLIKDGENWSHDFVDFSSCTSLFKGITISDFTKLGPDYWLSSSKGLLKWNEANACDSKLILYNGKAISTLKIHSFGNYILGATDKEGILIFDVHKEKYIGALDTEHSIIPLNSNKVLDVFDKGNSIVVTFIDASLQEIDKAILTKEILLGENPKTKPKFLSLEDNGKYISISDRNKYIHVYDLNWKPVHKIDISEMQALVDMKFQGDDLIFATVNEIVSVDLEKKVNHFSVVSPRNVNLLYVNEEHIYMLGAGYVYEVKKEGVHSENEKYIIDNTTYFVKQKESLISSRTTTLRSANRDKYKDFEIPKFIRRLKNGRNKDEVLILTKGQLFLFHIGNEKIDALEYENIEILDVHVKDNNELVVWDTKGIYLIDQMNEIHKIIDTDNPYSVRYFGGHYIYSSADKMYMVDEKDVIAKGTKDELSIYDSNHPFTIKNDVHHFSYNYFEKPLEISFGMNSIEANENGYFSFKDIDGEKQFVSIQDPLPISFFPEGKNHFNIQAYNQDGSLSNSIDILVKVKGPFWRQWWFYLLLGLFLLGGITIFFRNREKRMKEQYEIKREISQLEKSALQAQMNPHFIFNCLNSIQGFIMKNEKEQAMEYLGSFAQLIRSNLNASLTSLLALDEEIRILDNYIKLEKLRMRDVFDYEIKLAKDISDVDIFIPPMLIQPFVENAIIHGMNGKKAGGKIVISFEKEEPNILHVFISDNGDGVKVAKRVNHKSVGVAITRKRLAHINSTQNDDFNMKVLQEGEGTTVELKIKYSEYIHQA